MSSINPTRLTNGILILLGLIFFKPLAYFVAIMMIFAGVTGVCLLEKLFSKFGIQGKCDLK
ncbi:MAG: hypothetical protein A3J51_04380 [Omnitrophica WOR_2 bacterium RIFCSPHIGHO2_02_FULL_45_21]|nr:MAG: hypothetical protein A3J51_04380 [Omnitrophica WOR_2 bacterium RIFCSPHIGHO2_02_FULL_45_21]